jgi:hypothetical protein
LDACRDALFSALESAGYEPSRHKVANVRKAAFRYSQVVDEMSPSASPTGVPPGLSAPTTVQRAIYESYRESIKSALESRDATCGAIVTASLSILTAYGAVITLVTPKSEQPASTTLLPFGFLIAAFIVAAVGKLFGVRVRSLDTDEISTYGEAAEVIKRANFWKFWAGVIAIVLIGIGVFTAARSLMKSYGHASNLSDSHVVKDIHLNEQGQKLVSTACRSNTTDLTGTINVSDGFATVTLKDPTRCDNSQVVSVPTSAIGFIKAVQ